MTKAIGVAVENIYVGDVVFVENGRVRPARNSDGPLSEIELPPELNETVDFSDYTKF
jgi:hypothetical protein